LRQAQNVHPAHAAARLAGRVHLPKTIQQYYMHNNIATNDAKVTFKLSVHKAYMNYEQQN